MVVGTLRLVGGYELPKPGYGELSMQPSYMGQDLLNPPSVEGWHTGKEWINSGSLMSRINFVAEQVGNPDLPGVQADHRPAEGAGHARRRSNWSTTASICSARSRSAPTPRRS